MKRVTATILSLTLVSGLAANASAAEKPLKVFVLAGQSNMFGFGARVGELPADLKQPKDVLCYQGGAWMPLDAKTWKAGCGPEFTFGPALAKYYGEPVGLIKVTKSLIEGDKTRVNPDLAHFWSPDNPKGNYSPLVQLVKDSQKARPIVVVGMLWDQGSADFSNKESADNYQKNLIHFIESIRRDFGNPALPIVSGGENDYPGHSAGKFPYLDVVRQAQFSLQMPAYRCLKQDDLPRVQDTAKEDYQKHNDHYTTAGQVESGKRYAAAMIDILKAQAGGKGNP